MKTRGGERIACKAWLVSCSCVFDMLRSGAHRRGGDDLRRHSSTAAWPSCALHYGASACSALIVSSGWCQSMDTSLRIAPCWSFAFAWLFAIAHAYQNPRLEAWIFYPVCDVCSTCGLEQGYYIINTCVHRPVAVRASDSLSAIWLRSAGTSVALCVPTATCTSSRIIHASAALRTFWPQHATLEHCHHASHCDLQ